MRLHELRFQLASTPNAKPNIRPSVQHSPQVCRNVTRLSPRSVLSNTRFSKDLMRLDIPPFTAVQQCVPGCIHSACRPLYAVNRNFVTSCWLLLREIQLWSLSLIVCACVLLGEKCKGRLGLVHIHLFLGLRRGIFPSCFRIEFLIVQVCPRIYG
jgi:hypothetical protein